ncbi:class I SAM-dependent methyltransferase [Mycoplasma buteonis]|uniref:class I SAM-dependent methyltransferase n=1 Tax=Mycoplasma buteonis TaxID=171280 RepID=UPI00055DF961|nr:class I SAM-dependent methyltransferase [Mycoplasma buteonis]
MSKKQQISDYYDDNQTLNSYIEYASHGLWEAEKKHINNLLPLKDKNYQILDIGCGAGRTSFELAKLFPRSEILAIDIASGMINACEKQNTFDNLKFQTADLLNINDTKKFDFIFFSFNGITNNTDAEDLQKIFQKIHSLLKDANSIFLFTVHDMFSSAEYHDFWVNKKKVYDLDLFSDEKVLSRIDNGFECKNRFFTTKDMHEIAKLFNFQIILEEKRDDNLEPSWVKTLSTPVIFYAFSKIKKEA